MIVASRDREKAYHVLASNAFDTLVGSAEVPAPCILPEAWASALLGEARRHGRQDEGDARVQRCMLA